MSSSGRPTVDTTKLKKNPKLLNSGKKRHLKRKCAPTWLKFKKNPKQFNKNSNQYWRRLGKKKSFCLVRLLGYETKLVKSLVGEVKI